MQTRTRGEVPEMTGSRRRIPLLAMTPLAILAGFAILAGAGCARRAKVPLPPPSGPVVSEPPPRRHEPGPDEEEGIPLPGQNRYLPSDDPRNHPNGDALAALPEVETKARGEARPTAKATTAPLPSQARTPTPAAHEGAQEGAQEATSPGGTGSLPTAPPTRNSVIARHPVSTPRGEVRYRVQIFASSSAEKAGSLREEIASRTGEPAVVEGEGGVWKVRVGDAMTREEAILLRRRVSAMGYHDAFVLEVRPR